MSAARLEFEYRPQNADGTAGPIVKLQLGLRGGQKA